MNETYEKILKNAYELLSQYGYDNTSLNMVAKATDISKPSLYYYFSSKEELFNELFINIADEMKFNDQHDMAEFTKENFKKKLIEIGLSEIDTLLEDNKFASVFKEMIIYATRNSNVNKMFMEVILSYKIGFSRILKHGVEIGALPQNTDIDLKAQILTMVLDSISNFVSYDISFDYKKIWYEVINNMLG